MIAYKVLNKRLVLKAGDEGAIASGLWCVRVVGRETKTK